MLIFSLVRQYVGGETAQESLTAMHRLRSENKGALLVYSVEVDEASAHGSTNLFRDAPSEEPIHKRFVEEVISSIDTAGAFEDDIIRRSGEHGRTTCVGVKLVSS